MQVINTFTEAVQTVDMERAVGKPHTLWVQFARFYEEHQQIPEVRVQAGVQCSAHVRFFRLIGKGDF